jgi:hypothetical protein
MLGFFIVFGISIIALLAVQDMDVECLNQPRRQGGKRVADHGFPPYAAMREVR